ncbi:MAG: DNA cytosine methyltransferase [Alphaproteobacteria bacterium]|nr:DNA cytosine methyltransferase [Alphaproteobacteria bacterium]
MKTAIDLFAGVGGLSLGFELAGFKVLWANEYNKSIANAYKKNHPDTIVDSRDIRDIDIVKEFSKYVDQIDVVMGGPPCQGFSQKGKRIGLNDERNFMFKKFVEVVSVVKPKFFVLENVPNILTAENGYFKEQIIHSFGELGYYIDVKILKAEDFGVPQIRRRAVFLGKLGSDLRYRLPNTNHMVTCVEDAISDLPILKSGEGLEFVPYTQQPKSDYQKLMRIKSDGVWNHISTKHSKIALDRLKLVTLTSTKNDLPKDQQTKSIYSGTWTRMNPKGFSRTITTRFDTPASGQFTLPFQDRCLTVREAARLQSFPDNFIFYGKKMDQMLQVGNAVPPLLAKAIAETILLNED